MGRVRLGHAAGALLLALCLAACSSLRISQPVTPIRVDAGRAASLISAYRLQNGLGPVRIDATLMSAAADYAKAMGERDRIDHRIGGALPARLRAAGYDWGAAAENLAASFPSVDAAFAAWKSSAGHRRNLLNREVTEIGIAAVSTPPGAKRRNYWALILAAPRPQNVASGPFGMELLQ